MSKKKDKENRKAALERLAKLSQDVIDDIVLVVQTAEVQGDYHFDGDSSVWEDEVASTLWQLAREFQALKAGEAT
jgi:hypothetical protein